MGLTAQEILHRLGAGEAIRSVRSAAKMNAREFEGWWSREAASRVPDMSGTATADLEAEVEIVRDEWGIPHILAGSDDDLFFGYGYAMAQDRLWQLDFFRRRAMGRLAEVLGPDGLERDIAARTVGLNRIAARQIGSMPVTTVRRLEAFSRGINAVMEQHRDRLPIEFDLLGYQPEPWEPLHSVAVWTEFSWYLTGRLPVIALPELAKRVLGDGPLYQVYLTGEADDESIVPKGSYPLLASGEERVGASVGDPDEGLGSNNWLVSGERSATGAPLLASDPHIAFGSVSCWYEVHLSGGQFNAVGAGYVGVPGVIFGRNERVAWGVTNNICSQRDLYYEKTDPRHPDSFLYDSQWEPARTLTEEIAVKGGETVGKEVRFSRNGPIVNELLPEVARDERPVSLRWLGSMESDEISYLLAANVAESCAEFREALREWRVPTWSFGFADVDGHTGYHCMGRIPIRKQWDRGYRDGWDPEHQWNGMIPFDGMPALVDPRQGWIRSANNRTAPEDFPYPLSGTWSSGYRAKRIRTMLEEQKQMTRQDFARMQTDVLSLRAIEGVPHLLQILSGASDARIRTAASALESWDCRMEPDRVAASIFEVFFERWAVTVASQRFPEEAVPAISQAISGLAVELLSHDRHGWFEHSSREDAAIDALSQALDELASHLGPDASEWTWGKLHTVKLDHYLSERGDLSQLLGRGGQPVGGNGITVSNTGHDPNYLAALGANYRLIADLSESPPGLWAVDAAGQSGHPGSPHYCDQLPEWLAGRHHYLPLDTERVRSNARTTLKLRPPD